MDKKFIITNCLSDDLRQKLLVDCKPFLKKVSDQNPGYQSDAPLRQFSQFNIIHQKMNKHKNFTKIKYNYITFTVHLYLYITIIIPAQH